MLITVHANHSIPSPDTKSFSSEFPEQLTWWKGCFACSSANQDGGVCDEDSFLLTPELWLVLWIFVLVGSLRAEDALVK